MSSVVLLLGFVLILAAAHFTARWFGGKMGRFGVSKYFKIIDRISLSSDSFICIMRIGANHYIFGVSKTNIQLLDKIKECDIEIITSSEHESQHAFSGILHKYLNFKQSDSDEKGRQ